MVNRVPIVDPLGYDSDGNGKYMQIWSQNILLHRHTSKLLNVHYSFSLLLTTVFCRSIDDLRRYRPSSAIFVAEVSGRRSVTLKF